MDASKISAQNCLSTLRALAEPTRLRIVVLLSEGELTVKDLTSVLGQSQPRISRHLKLLNEAGVLSRFQEGSWVYFRLADNDKQTALVQSVLSRLNDEDPEFRRDRDRAHALRVHRAEQAQQFFAEHAERWDELRALHVDEAELEQRLLDIIGPEPFATLVDLGTGTGRIMELLADRYRRAIGVDTNQTMLGYARARIEHGGLTRAQVRQGDICNLTLDDGIGDLVVMHQVLHYLGDPLNAIEEAARILRPGGRLLVVDFAAHQLDHLREQFAHQRLGFGSKQMHDWLRHSGLQLETYAELPPTPTASTHGLTVCIWLASRQPATPAQQTRLHDKLEIAQ